MKTLRHIALASILLLQACATMPTQFYSLDAIASNNGESHNVDKKTLIGVTQMTLPTLLERKQIVTHDAYGKLILSEQHQWAGLLKQNMTEVVANNFATVYPHFWFKAYPWSTLGMVDYRMVIDVTQLNIIMGKSITFSANWALINEKTHTVIAHDNVALEQVLVDDNYANLVNAINQLLAQFAQEVHFSQHFPS
ncbi:MAG: hypothetical protein RLZZ384_1045 [Pseudomonadota bacterium]